MCLMKLGMKHSLCLISIVSKAQPSESMPMRNSYFFPKRSSGLSDMEYLLRLRVSATATRLMAVGLRHILRQLRRGKERLQPGQADAAADQRHAGPVTAEQGLGVLDEVVGDVGAVLADPRGREVAF